MRELQLEATKRGARLFRNSVGQYTTTDRNGNPRTIRFGLCIGSSDLIGWTPVVITPDMVGQTVAVFTAVEAKTLRGTASKSQISFIRAVQEAGGLAVIARSPEDLP